MPGIDDVTITIPVGHPVVPPPEGYRYLGFIFANADDPAAALRTADSGAPLAGILLVAVLGLILLETALARWFSHSLPPGKIGSSGGADGTAGMAGTVSMAEAAAIAPHG